MVKNVSDGTWEGALTLYSRRAMGKMLCGGEADFKSTQIKKGRERGVGRSALVGFRHYVIRDRTNAKKLDRQKTGQR